MHHVAKAVAGLLLSAATLPAFAVTFGSPDGSAHPFVGNLLFERPDGYYSCTGTMMSPTVMLTAGHCTEELGVANVRTWVTFNPDVSIDSGCATRACLNAWLDDPANGWVRGTAIPHPQYDDFAGWPKAPTYDVGIVTFDAPISMAVYGELAPLGFLESIRKAADNKFTVVGYGQQGLIKPFLSEEWRRYVGSLKLIETGSSWTGGGMSAKFTNNPGTGGGTCFGDSGGPIFYKDTNVVVAVVSWGQTPCIGVDFNFRTDVPATLDFVEPYL